MWYTSYLENRKQCVRVMNVTSVYLDYNIGFPQGSILGSLLFGTFVNDLPNVCPPDVICQRYADDVVLYVHAKSQHRNGLTMNEVAQWLINSRLHLNVLKTILLKGQIMM